ncbi:MAG: hypothetical protein M1486_06690 [Gammaproteobacteria bacterium]|nr:hypothetical protein [Gammaproteobacteria bacterium]
MSHINFRFYLIEDASPLDPEQTQNQIIQILNEAEGLQLVRVAIDLTGQNKNISMLCKSNDHHVTQAKVRSLLWAEGIALSEQIEIEQLEDEHDKGHEDHAHHSKPKKATAGKKREKNSKHAHNHHEHTIIMDMITDIITDMTIIGLKQLWVLLGVPHCLFLLLLVLIFLFWPITPSPD